VDAAVRGGRDVIIDLPASAEPETQIRISTPQSTQLTPTTTQEIPQTKTSMPPTTTTPTIPSPIKP